MNCEDFQIRDRLPEYALGKLPPEEEERVRAHLARCSRCRDELDIIAIFSRDQVPDPPPGFWVSLPGRVVSGGVPKPRWFFPSPIPAWSWGLAAAAVLAAVIMGAWPSAPPGMENGMLAEYCFRGGESPMLGIEEEILSFSGLTVAEVGLSLEKEIDLTGGPGGIDLLDDIFPRSLFEGMDGATIRIFERMVEDMTPDGVERG